MKQAKVTKEFPGLEDGQTAVRQIRPGEIIAGELAAVALREGWAEPIAIDAMTAVELKAYAVDRGIDLGDATKKADIIAAIELASQG